jgi:hypothetical protein
MSETFIAFQLFFICIALGISIGRSSFAEIRPKHILFKRTLAHRVCVCVTHENVILLLKVLSKEVRSLKNNLNDFVSKLVCSDNSEDCMMSRCDDCMNNFDAIVVQKIIDKHKIINWYQWTNQNGRAIKEKYSGKNEF